MEPTTPAIPRSVDVTGLPDEAVRSVEALVADLREKQQRDQRGGIPLQFSSRDEWRKAIREWADSHKPVPHEVDDSRESIYAGRGE